MKNIILLAAGLMASSMVSAVTLTQSDDPADRTITMIDCPLLNEDVVVSLTGGVVGGAQCDETVIGLAMCHTAGRLTARSQPLDANGLSCTLPAAGEPANGCEVQQVTGAQYPSATSLTGTVLSQYPGGNACSTANAEAAAGTVAGIAAEEDPAP